MAQDLSKYQEDFKRSGSTLRCRVCDAKVNAKPYKRQGNSMVRDYTGEKHKPYCPTHKRMQEEQVAHGA